MKKGKNYELDSSNVHHQAVVICALDTVIKFLNNDIDYKNFHATVVGCGGMGTSFVINTLIALIRKYTNRNDTVKVAAPCGGAAYNVQGCTLHRTLSFSVNATKLCQPLLHDKQAELSSQLENLLMLIIDERSMLSSKLVAGAE